MSFAKAIASFNLNLDLPNSCLGEEKSLELEQVISEQRAHLDQRRLMSPIKKTSSLEDKTNQPAPDSAAAEISPEDQIKAAEAVVDAAICCQSLGSDLGISAETRAFLVDAVLQDPTLTPKLFTEDFHQFMRF